VTVDGGEAGRRRVQFAVDLAARTGARMSGLHVTPPAEVPLLYRPSLVAEVAAKASFELALDARAAATVFAEEATQRLPESSWLQAEGDVADHSGGKVLLDALDRRRRRGL